MDNDLRSTSRGEGKDAENLVGVLARHHRCSRSQAAARARELLGTCMDDYAPRSNTVGRRIALARRWQSSTGTRTGGRRRTPSQPPRRWLGVLANLGGVGRAPLGVT
ncbi:hypothetical protein [Streptomyces sp. MMBL 11-3]|uniref:hypothetical protein n=1 Tax=Streptomyces sp. MMBL 11-3 TaxID=3382639 RepID=UPI0039B5237B